MKFIAETPSRACACCRWKMRLALEEQPNLPGTIDEHPNWRRRYAGRGRHAARSPDSATRDSQPLAERERAMTAPRATMRLQFHRGFTFADAAAAGAVLRGARHQPSLCLADHDGAAGLDAWLRRRRSDAVNPELGGEDGFRGSSRALRRHEMGVIVDIVPNHMAVGSGNPLVDGRLAHGRNSRYAKFFDIDWKPDDPHLRGKVLLAGPRPALRRSARRRRDQAARVEDGRGLCPLFRSHISACADDAAHAVEQSLARGITIPASADGRERLHELLEEQHYRLAWWRAANDEINWRRFFDINELAALRVEDDEVFEAVHATVFRLYARGLDRRRARRPHRRAGAARATIAASCGRGLQRTRDASGRRMPRRTGLFRRRENPVATMKSCRTSGRPTARPATTSWTKLSALAARCRRRSAVDARCGSASAAGPAISTTRRNWRAGRSWNAAFPRSARARCRRFTQIAAKRPRHARYFPRGAPARA